MEQIFKKVEQVLSNYPDEWTRNYYQNKETLEIKTLDDFVGGIKGLFGAYYDEDNHIEIRGLKPLSHELIHMAFHDEKKYNTKVFDDRPNILYGNRLFMCSKKDDEKKIINKSIGEGFTEYVSRKCVEFKGQQVNYYFADLLISIFGEDLLKYAFLNDPIGFFADQRFDYISIFTGRLDKLNECSNIMVAFGQLASTKEDISEELEFIKTDIIPRYNSLLIDTFDAIIREYNKYSDRLINREQLNIKLQNFMNDYDFYGTFVDERYNVKKYLKGQIK